MAYIGKQPVVGNFVKLDAIVTSATATYNLLNGGTAYFPQTANNCIVSLNGVIQSPTSAYTISGSTIVFDSALTSADSIDFILVLGDVLSIGTPSDGTVTSAKLASGLSGLISWQSVQTTGFTASAGRGYPCNTTSAAFTVTLPASPSVGDTIILLDYAGTFATNNITLGRNSNKIEGGTTNKLLTTNREAVTLTYVDSTQGWVSTSASNYGIQSIDPFTIAVSYLVVAGGGGGGYGAGGGGGAGGLLSSTANFTVGQVYTVTVGAGGTAPSSSIVAGNGSDSVISGSGITTITAIGGGGAGSGANGNTGDSDNGASGGSGGGGGGYDGGTTRTGGAGTSGQGNVGGNGNPNATYYGAGGGGGSGGVGGNGSTSAGGTGGTGTVSSITGSSVTYSTGGTGSGATGGAGSAGTANTGNGGNGGSNGGFSGGIGGSGVVILSVPTANYSSTTTGSPTVTTSGANTIIKFTGSGSYTG
jgi:hypothetical protein